jgi:hypothetical protein
MFKTDGALEVIVDDWMATFSQHDEVERRRLLEHCWVEDGRFVASLVDVIGIEQIAKSIGEVMALLPDHHARRSSKVQRHFDQVRFSWEMVNKHDEVILYGLDVAQIDKHGRFMHLTGFAGPLVALT